MQINKTKNKVIFMGTPKIAAECLAAILAREDVEVVAVVCQPDRPVGRKKEIIFSPVKQLALDNNLKVLQDEKVSNLYEQIKQLNADLIFTCAFGQFIPEKILSLPKYKCVNLHASLLPKLRGGAPIQWAIINQETKTGFTLMYMEKKMDAGNIIKQYELPIASNETYASLYDKLCVLAKDIIAKDFNIICNEKVESISQDESKVTFGYNITRENEKIDWKKQASEVDALVRGLYPTPSAYTILDDQIIKVLETEVLDLYPNAIPGMILDANKNGVQVSTGNKVINLKVVQLAGKKPCEVKQLLNGNHPFIKGKLFN